MGTAWGLGNRAGWRRARDHRPLNICASGAVSTGLSVGSLTPSERRGPALCAPSGVPTDKALRFLSTGGTRSSDSTLETLGALRGWPHRDGSLPRDRPEDREPPRLLPGHTRVQGRQMREGSSRLSRCLRSVAIGRARRSRPRSTAPRARRSPRRDPVAIRWSWFGFLRRNDPLPLCVRHSLRQAKESFDSLETAARL